MEKSFYWNGPWKWWNSWTFPGLQHHIKQCRDFQVQAFYDHWGPGKYRFVWNTHDYTRRDPHGPEQSGARKDNGRAHIYACVGLWDTNGKINRWFSCVQRQREHKHYSLLAQSQVASHHKVPVMRILCHDIMMGHELLLDRGLIKCWALSQYKDCLSQVWGFPC